MGEISVMHLLELLWKRLWVLVIAAAVFAVGAFAYCEFWTEPRYAASSAIIVTNGNIIVGQDDQIHYDDVDGTVNNTDISASLSLANTVKDILSSDSFYDEVANTLNADENFAAYGKYSYTRLAGMVSVARRNQNTLSIDITVRSGSIKEAQDVANAIADYSRTYILKYIPQSKTEVLDRARASSKVYPQTSLITAAGALIGAILAYVLVFIIDMLNQTIRGEEEFAGKYDIPLLGSVPDFENVEVIGSYKRYQSSYKSGN